MQKDQKQRKKITLTQTGRTQAGRGLDVGTAFIYCAQKQSSQVVFRTQRNAFFEINYSEFTQGILERSGVKYVLSRDKIFVVGDDSIKFANLFGKSTRRPLRNGVISPGEKEALPIVELIIKSVLGPPCEKNEICYYSVPGNPIDADFDTIYHQNIIKGFLEKWGYGPKPLNEGLAVIFSELAQDDFTGIGISLGGGMANICLAILAMPVFSFSVAKAGDWIDEQVAKVTNEPMSKITTFKETTLDLSKPETSMTRIEQALSIYYNHLIEYILTEIQKEITRNRIPEFEKPIPMVVGGGTANPPGFIERFRKMLEKTNFPFEIREARLAPHPLYAVAKGTLIAAIADSKKSQ